MKKILLLFLILPFVLVGYIRDDVNQVLSLNGVSKVCIVTKDSTKEFDSIQTAQLNYAFFDSGNEDCKLKPEAVVIYMNSSLEKLVKELNLMVDREENIYDMQIVYGFTPKYNDFVLSNNKRINTQIVIQGDKMVVGFPMILTGF